MDEAEEFTNLVARGDVAAVRAAIDAGADPNALSDGTAPIYLARDPATIALLLERGARPDW
ncbi:MAG: hypothetical protein MUC96_05705 [Myxococcaceae bacterium]|jgi:hypothetical protein|nr:hypothetical protein [Myxococcaceae bacterium]